MKYLWGLISLALAACAAVLIRPDLLSVTRDLALATPLAQVMSLRLWLAAGLLFVAVALLIFLSCATNCWVWAESRPYWELYFCF